MGFPQSPLGESVVSDKCNTNYLWECECNHKDHIFTSLLIRAVIDTIKSIGDFDGSVSSLAPLKEIPSSL